jgi:tetratricopeptide (TPR) repeat protein
MVIGTFIWLFLAFLGPQAIADEWKTSTEEQRIAWRKSMREATTLLNQQHREEAARVMESAIREARNVGQPDDAIAGALNDLGTIYHEMERYADANRCYKQAISTLEHCAPSSPKMVTALVNLAGLRVHQLKYSEAEKLYQRAERISDSKLASNSPTLASVYHGLSVLLVRKRSFPEAREFGERALCLLAGTKDQNLGGVLFLLGKIALEQRRLEEAENLIRRAIAVWRTSDGEDGPQYASGIVALAALLSAKDPSQSEGLFHQALEIIPARLGTRHSLNGLALLAYSKHLQSHGRKDQAKELRRRAEEILGPKSQQNLLTVDIATLAGKQRPSN